MNLTKAERAVLAHVVIDPDAWIAHAVATVGEDAVQQKIEAHREAYDAAKTTREYATRAERQAEADAARAAQREAHIQACEQRRTDLATVAEALPTKKAKEAMTRLIGPG